MPVLDDVTINQPVEDIAALALIPTQSLAAGDQVMVLSDTTVRRWTGSAWALIGSYLYAADQSARNNLTFAQVNNGQLVSQVSDTTLWMASVSGEVVNWSQIGAGGGSGSFDPFDAKVTSAPDFNSAISSGKKVIFLANSFTLTQDVQLLQHTYFYIGVGVHVQLSSFRIDQNNFRISFEGSSMLEQGISYDPAVANKSPIYNSQRYGIVLSKLRKLGQSTAYPVSLTATKIINLNTGSFANTSVCVDSPLILKDVLCLVGTGDNAGINVNQANSSFTNLTISTLSPAATNCVVFGSGCVNGTNLVLRNQNLVSGQFAQFAENNSISELTCSSGGGFAAVNIASKAKLSLVQTTDQTPINITMLGTSSKLSDSSLHTGSITLDDGATNPTIVGTYASGAFNAGTAIGYCGAGNSGTIPNTGAGASIGLSPFEATLDSVGLLSNHYINVGTAYPAIKTYVYGIANIAETANIFFNPADQIYFQIAQNFTHSLGAFSFVGSFSTSPAVAGGNALTIEFADASSIFEYGYGAPTLPFENFDANSTIIIDAKGGSMRNTSTAANTYIECLGTLSIRTAQVLLPNASAGGIKSHQYTQLDGVEFTGGGSSCDTAIIANGGNLGSVIIDGDFTDNSILIEASAFTAYNTIDVSIPTNGTIEVWGVAQQIISSSKKLGGFVTVTPKNSSLLPGTYDPSDITEINGGTWDELAVPSGLQGCKISNATIGLLSLPSDNSTQIDFDNCTFINNFTFYGDSSFTNCRMLASFDAQTGSIIGLSNCRSGSEVTFASGVTKYRAANDANIGNDSISKIVKEVRFSDSPYAAASNELVICDTTGGNIVVNLPSTSIDSGKDIYFSLKGAGNVDLTPTSPNTILGLTSKTITGNNTGYIITPTAGDWRLF